MSILTDLMATIVQIKQRLNNLSNRMFDVERSSIVSLCSSLVSNYDSIRKRYLTITYTRPNNTVAMRSVLSGLNAGTGLYMQRTETYYNTAGDTVVRTVVYSLAYDIARKPISETIVSVTI